MFKNSGLTKSQQQIKLEDFKTSPKTAPMLEMAHHYLAEFNQIITSDDYNKGMALTGTVGIGKTMLAVAVTNELLARKIPVLFITTTDLMAELRVAQFAEDPEELENKIHRLSRAQVAVFDDLGREKATEWVQTQYFRIIDARYRAKMPTLFTSNYTFEEIDERLGNVIASRLYDMTKGHAIYIKADDYRLK